MTPLEAIETLESAGGAIRLDGPSVKVKLPRDYRGAVQLLTDLRTLREEIVMYLKERNAIPLLPDGVRLVRWELKPAPVILTRYAVVTDVSRFVTMTLLELKAALAGKRWQAGNWGIRQLIERLEECGVIVEVKELHCERNS